MTKGSSKLSRLFGEMAPYARAKIMPLAAYFHMAVTLTQHSEAGNGH